VAKGSLNRIVSAPGFLLAVEDHEDELVDNISRNADQDGPPELDALRGANPDGEQHKEPKDGEAIQGQKDGTPKAKPGRKCIPVLPLRYRWCHQTKQAATYSGTSKARRPASPAKQLP